MVTTVQEGVDVHGTQGKEGKGRRESRYPLTHRQARGAKWLGVSVDLLFSSLFRGVLRHKTLGGGAGEVGSVCLDKYASSRYHNKTLGLATTHVLRRGGRGVIAACCTNTLLIQCMLPDG